MSKMKHDSKPPLAKSPSRLRLQRFLRSSNITTVQSPPGSLTKSMKPTRTLDMEESGLPLAKMVGDEFVHEGTRVGGIGNVVANSTPMLERGRFYEYATRRNERLKRKKRGEAEDFEGKIMATPYKLGVTVEYSKRRDSKKLESLRKSVSAAYSVERNENPRYMLRSSTKEMKKPSLAVNNNSLKRSVLPSERKIGTRRGRRI